MPPANRPEVPFFCSRHSYPAPRSRIDHQAKRFSDCVCQVARATPAKVAYWAKKQGYRLNAISFKHGQIAIKETDCAQKIAEKLGVPIKAIDLSTLKEVFGEVTSLCNLDIPMKPCFSQPIIVPFSGKPKSEIMKIGANLGMPFEYTWSCYFNSLKHCGKCEACINRKKHSKKRA